MPRDVSLSDSICWNGGHEWVKTLNNLVLRGLRGFREAPDAGRLLSLDMFA